MLGEKFDASRSEQRYRQEAPEKREFTMESVEPYAFSRLMSPEWRLEMLERVDQLLGQIKHNGIEELIFLDKSARPLSWLFRERLKYSGSNQGAPKMKYIDLGTMEVYGEKTIIEEMSEEVNTMYKSLSEDDRKAYTEDDEWWWKKGFFAEGSEVDGDIWMSKKNIPKIWMTIIEKHQDFLERLRSRYGKELGKKVLVIDDLLMSGNMLQAAVALFTQAYPQSEVFGIHFFNQKYKNPCVQIPWFKKSHMIGVEEDEGSLTTKKFTGTESEKPDLSPELRTIIMEIAHMDREKLREEIKK